MTASKIHGSNFTFKAPPGMPDCSDLHVLRTTINNGPAILSSWTPDDDERQRIADGADVVLTILGTGLPPVGLNAACWVCDMCGEPVHPDEATIGGKRHREPCNGLALAAQTPEESEALKESLAAEIGEALRERPDKYVETGDALFLEWGMVRPHIEGMQSVIRVLAAQLGATNSHSDMTRRIASDAIAKMHDRALPEPGTVEPAILYIEHLETARKALACLNSMILSGESHSAQSLALFRAAMDGTKAP